MCPLAVGSPSFLERGPGGEVPAPGWPSPKTQKAPAMPGLSNVNLKNYAENDEPQPQVLLAWGLLNVKPRALRPS
jgi:hypothetical protein